ncbi:MAG: response regulator [Elainellaceae cyanobacterium]
MPNSKKVPNASANAADSIGTPEDLMEAELQQELRSMFDVDTQNGLQTYLDLANHLQPYTWKRDIQTLYRMVHTIKGGAVTVRADGILQVATVLEDLLSDLRQVETAPALEDGELAEILVEAGELLASASLIEARGAAASALVEPSVQRIHQLRSQVQDRYMPQWSMQKQIQQEFVQQGFDLVVLDLEIALENLAEGAAFPEGIVDTARSVLEQLHQIGQALQLSTGWRLLLEQAETLLEEPNAQIWQIQWSRLLQALKDCARAGGEPAPLPLDVPEEVLTPAAEPALHAQEPDKELNVQELEPQEPELQEATTASEEELFDFEEEPFAVDDSDTLAALDRAIAEFMQDTATNAIAAEADAVAPYAASQLPEAVPEAVHNLDAVIESSVDEEDAEASIAEVIEVLEETPDSSIPALKGDPTTAPDSTEQVQIPVPLERLDRSAQDLVNALLSVRSTQGVYQVLQAQVMQLVSLAQEGSQYITRLRQIQDDYALVDNLKLELPQTGPTPERYRQGYVTINRLLETSLRLSELGAETAKSATEMAESLQLLDSSVLKLQATVEESRLVPFRDLGFRARAILRDLTTRFGKSAQLVMQGEHIELDVGSARSLEPILLHLIRNAFSHALESVEERQILGKPRRGTLTLSLQRLGNVYRLNLQDDGRGINAQAIGDRARELALPLTDTSTPASLLAVICQPGFSSKTGVSDVSGRGVGMDVVASQIASMGGKLTFNTILGAGTTFSIQFPVPHLLVPCLLLRAGDRTFAIPFEDAKSVALLDSLRASPINTQDAPFSWQIETEGKLLPGLDLLEYWQPQMGHRDLSETAVSVYIHSTESEQSIWLIADELIGQSDLLINSLPAPLQPPEGMMGVSLQPDGTLVPVLNVAAIIECLHAGPQQRSAQATSPSDASAKETTGAPTILIVDDAALMRRRIEASLSLHGHPTHTCSDGLEAWNWLKTNPTPALVITDIEMPNMDGFTLIDRCRQDQMSMPILVVSSRLSEDWFAEAQRLGANDYLTKGFSTVDLLNKVNDLTAREVRAR